MKRTTLLLVLAVALLAVFGLAGCGQQTQPAATQPAATEPAPVEEPAQQTEAHEFPEGVSDVTELQTEDLAKGDGAVAEAGKTVTVNYTGWLTDGTKFDSSLDAGQPFTFGLGAGQVIPGWDKGVEGMKVGGKRVLVIPADMGYGAQGTGPIPPNATLVFQVDLLDVQ